MKVTKIKHGIEPGTEIPEQQRHGNVGRWVESVLKDKGHNIDPGSGCDMPEYQVEVKSRMIESTSPHTVGSMTIKDIINTPYDQSVIAEKFQTQYRVHYSNEGQVVLDSQIYDFSDDHIQSYIREAYELGRAKITANEANGYHPPYVKGSKWGQFEITDSCSGYRFRIPNGAMKTIEKVARNAKTFERFFELTAD